MTSTSIESVLDALCPMHLVVSATGHITHAGPTAQKLCALTDLRTMRFLEVFNVKRPRAVTQFADLASSQDLKLHLELRRPPRTSLKGIIVPMLGSHDAQDGASIINLSFGISIIDGVRDYSLTNADFAATDLAIEMLYLVEAKTAAMEASRRLNIRLQGAKIAAEEQAFTDTLTGLKNRRALDTVLKRLLDSPSFFAVMQIDLDYFKAVNDTLGHAAGDHVLQTVARIMVEETRGNDIVARVGGDEFTIVLPDVRCDDVLRLVAHRIIDRLKAPIPFQGEDCRVSASIGTVWMQSGNAPSLEELLSDADLALYASKHAGRARQTLYSPELRSVANSISAPQGRTRGTR
jgi:diguanylate cyclase (GGDEF)-like protein